MEAERRGDGAGHAAGRRGEGGLLELGHHAALAEPAEVAAQVLVALVGRVLARGVGEGDLAALDAGLHFAGLRLGARREQDVAGADRRGVAGLDAHDAGDVGLVAGHHRPDHAALGEVAVDGRRQLGGQVARADELGLGGGAERVAARERQRVGCGAEAVHHRVELVGGPRRVGGGGVLGEADVLDRVGRLALVVLDVVAVVAPVVAVGDLDLVVRDGGVAEADQLGGGLPVLADELVAHLARRHARGRRDEGRELGLAPVPADLLLDGLELVGELAVRVFHHLLERRAVDAAVAVGEDLRDERVGVVAGDEGEHLLVGHLDAEAVHLALDERVVDEAVEDAVLDLALLRAGHLEALGLVRVELLLDGAVVELALDGDAVHLADGAPVRAHADGVEGARVLEGPEAAEGDHQNADEEAACALPNAVHHSHVAPPPRVLSLESVGAALKSEAPEPQRADADGRLEGAGKIQETGRAPEGKNQRSRVGLRIARERGAGTWQTRDRVSRLGRGRGALFLRLTSSPRPPR